jgi:hypothetical protein
MITDGKYLELRSVPLDRMEVDGATLAQLTSNVSTLNIRIDGLDFRVAALEAMDLSDVIAAANAHYAKPISTAHSGQIVGTQIPNGIVTESMTNFITGYVKKTGSVAETITGHKTFQDAVTIGGNLVVSGTTVTVNTQNLAIQDNEIVLNSLESGDGVTLGFSGIRIERGTGTDYLIRFDESTDRLTAGFSGNLKNVAFEDDTSGILTSGNRGNAVFAGNASNRLITMATDLGSTYEVSVTPRLSAAGDIGNLGSWYWVRVSGTQFRVYNTGSDSTTSFSWIAQKV